MTTSNVPTLRTSTHGELQACDVVPFRPIIADLIAPGISVLAGAPKCGKSLLAMQLAGAVATGSPFLGHECATGSVLYVDFELSKAVRKYRSGLILGTDDVPQLMWVEEPDVVPQLGSGFEVWVEQELNLHAHRLIVIDTYVHVAPQADGQWSTKYTQDAKALERLNRVMTRFPDSAMLLVTHAREAKADGPLDAIYGSRGFTGAIDGAMLLTEEPGYMPGDFGPSHRLECVTRHFAPRNPIALRRDFSTLRYGVDSEPVLSPQRRLRDMVVEVLATASEPMSAAEVGRRTGEKPGSIRNTMLRMVRRQQLCKHQDGYWLPGMSFVPSTKQTGPSSIDGVTLRPPHPFDVPVEGVTAPEVVVPLRPLLPVPVTGPVAA